MPKFAGLPTFVQNFVVPTAYTFDPWNQPATCSDFSTEFRALGSLLPASSRNVSL